MSCILIPEAVHIPFITPFHVLGSVSQSDKFIAVVQRLSLEVAVR